MSRCQSWTPTCGSGCGWRFPPLVRGAAATTIYITHDQAEAFALADRVGVLRHGRLVQAGPPEEIYTSPATPFVARFTGLSGELPVRIRPVEAGFVEVEPPGANGARPLRLRAPAAPGAGPPALLMIRPTGVRLVSELGDEHHLPGSWPTLRSVAGATSTPSTFPGPAGSPGCSPRRARLGGNRSGSGSSPAAATSSRARLRGL